MLKSLSEQRSDCAAEIKFLGDKLDYARSKARPNPISVMRLENLLAESLKNLAQIDLQEQAQQGS